MNGTGIMTKKDKPHTYKHLKDYLRAQWLKRYKLKRLGVDR